MYATYKIGDPAIIFPVELHSETAKEVHNLVRQQLKIPKVEKEIQSTIEHNSMIKTSVIKELEPLCPSINKRFQIGIHIGSQTGISDPVDINNDGAFNLDITFNNASKPTD